VAGNPAKIISTIEEYEIKNIKFNLNTKRLTPEEKASFLKNLEDSKF
jgi:hypothetical protein